jgi:hypothetical protein
MVGLLRAALLMVLSPVFSIVLGIAIGKQHGFWYGCLAGLVVFVISGIIAAKLANRGGKLTVADCVIPTILSIISGIVFAPIQLFEGSVFSAATCIFSGVLLSTGMLLYKYGRMKGWALVLPSLTFVYELLPIELPTDLDNIFALGGSCFTLWWGYVKNVALGKGMDRLLDNSDNGDVIDVNPGGYGIRNFKKQSLSHGKLNKH